MSHFVVLVFQKPEGKDLEELLAPFDESIEFAPYVKYTREQAIQKARKEIEEYKNGLYAEYLKDKEKYEKENNDEAHINYLRNEFPQKLNWTDEQCYQSIAKWYEDDMIDSNGNLLSTYNPISKWDWYQVGGRWNGMLTTLEGNRTNEDYASEINWEKSIPFAFIEPNGSWHEKGDMGWWGLTSNEKSNEEWEKEFLDYVRTLEDNVVVTVVDCHI